MSQYCIVVYDTALYVSAVAAMQANDYTASVCTECTYNDYKTLNAFFTSVGATLRVEFYTRKQVNCNSV